MPHSALYRLFLFEEARLPGERSARPEAFRASGDAHAVRLADERRKGQYAELWRGSDLLKIFEP